MNQVQVKNHDAERVYRVVEKILEGVKQAEAGKIPFSAVFNNIPIRDMLPQYMIIPTTWHIDDLRDYVEGDVSDDELFEKLKSMERALREGAVQGGLEVIQLLIAEG